MKQKRLLWIQSPPEKAVPASCSHSFYSRGSLQQEFLRELAEISFCNSVGTLSPFLVLVKTVTFHCSTLFLSRLLSFFQQNGAGRGRVQLERHAWKDSLPRVTSPVCLPPRSSPPGWMRTEVCAAWADNALLLDWIHGPFQSIVVLVVIKTWPRDTSWKAG